MALCHDEFRGSRFGDGDHVTLVTTTTTGLFNAEILKEKKNVKSNVVPDSFKDVYRYHDGDAQPTSHQTSNVAE
ncbi:hypothetical protein TNCV_4820201 [Trichonephila clavipes]|nr:hypothetical protein TNCV_4820201 [Trichonephila clavipes]